MLERRIGRRMDSQILLTHLTILVQLLQRWFLFLKPVYLWRQTKQKSWQSRIEGEREMSECLAWRTVLILTALIAVLPTELLIRGVRNHFKLTGKDILTFWKLKEFKHIRDKIIQTIHASLAWPIVTVSLTVYRVLKNVFSWFTLPIEIIHFPSTVSIFIALKLSDKSNLIMCWLISSHNSLCMHLIEDRLYFCNQYIADLIIKMFTGMILAWLIVMNFVCLYKRSMWWQPASLLSKVQNRFEWCLQCQGNRYFNLQSPSSLPAICPNFLLDQCRAVREKALASTLSVMTEGVSVQEKFFWLRYKFTTWLSWFQFSSPHWQWWDVTTQKLLQVRLYFSHNTSC